MRVAPRATTAPAVGILSPHSDPHWLARVFDHGSENRASGKLFDVLELDQERRAGRWAAVVGGAHFRAVGARPPFPTGALTAKA
jgi:hypothetical protein